MRTRHAPAVTAVADFAGNVVTGFARIEGRAVGLVANQPLALAGTLAACTDAGGPSDGTGRARAAGLGHAGIVDGGAAPAVPPSSSQARPAPCR